MPRAEIPKIPPPDHSLLARLKTLRNGKLDELAKLQFELSELDAEIGWLERFPQVERIIRSLLGKA
jgi:hypothetical protein